MNDALLELAIIAAGVALRRVINSDTAARIADTMAAEGRRLPNATESAEIDTILGAATARLDQAIARAENEGR